MSLILIHSGDKHHKCEPFGKVFAEKGVLTQHMLIHTGDIPYVCDICRKSFTQNGSLHRHMRIHSGDKPHRCEFVGDHLQIKVVFLSIFLFTLELNLTNVEHVESHL